MSDEETLRRFRLDGRRILVTGATGHLGRPIARAIAGAGGVPIVAGRSQQKLTELVGELERAGLQALPVVFDVGDPQQCRDAVARLTAAGGRLDGLVNGAYSGRTNTLESTRDEDFELACRHNLAGPFALIQAALPALRGAAQQLPGGASVVNIGSMYGHVSPDPAIYGSSGMNNPPYYGASKAGLLQLTRYLAAHLGRDKIRVNSVSPGPFPPASIAQTSPQFHAQLTAKTPLGRIGAADEVAGPVLFLLSAAASFVTGADLAVDGGWTAW